MKKCVLLVGIKERMQGKTGEEMNAEMINWDLLLNHLEQRWDMSHLEVCEQLVITIRYAVYSPLAFIRSASSLLKEKTESLQVRTWATECYRKSKDWMDKYWIIQENCLQNAIINEVICKCLLQGIGSLFADGADLLHQEAQLRDLVKGEMAQVADMIAQKLSVVIQIHDELRSGNLSWLLRYINEEDRR